MHVPFIRPSVDAAPILCRGLHTSHVQPCAASRVRDPTRFGAPDRHSSLTRYRARRGAPFYDLPPCPQSSRLVSVLASAGYSCSCSRQPISAPHAPLILLIDGTLERRWGKRIAYKGRFHDAVRSQSGHVATSEGIHWLCLMLLVPVPWCQRSWALPVLSVPTLTPVTSAKLGKRHRTTAQAAQILIALIRRWYPEREIVLVGDGGFAATSLGHTCRRLRVRFVSRLLLTAQLYDPVPPQRKGKPGVKPTKGPRQAKLTQRVTNRTTTWLSQEIGWYAEQQLKMDLLDGSALWHRDGEAPLPVRLSSSCAIPVASARRLPSFAPTRPFPCCKSSPGTSVAGTSRSPLKKPGLISGWKPSGNGALPPSLGPLLVCWGCSAWWSSWLMLSTQIICQHGKLPGIPKPNPPLPMPWPLFVAICGGSGIRQPCLLPGGLSIRPMSSMTRSSKLPVMLPKMAKVESGLLAIGGLSSS